MKLGKGFGMGYDKSDSLIDIVMERTEMYYKRYGQLPTTAYVYRGITDDEVKSIKELGNIVDVIPQYKFRMILIGSPLEDDERKARLSDSQE